jgi:hypothetical protein
MCEVHVSPQKIAAFSFNGVYKSSVQVDRFCFYSRGHDPDPLGFFPVLKDALNNSM